MYIHRLREYQGRVEYYDAYKIAQYIPYHVLLKSMSQSGGDACLLLPVLVLAIPYSETNFLRTYNKIYIPLCWQITCTNLIILVSML